jgi:hypothetical protein
MSTPRTCPSCGATVAAGERFCANCGTRIQDQPTPGAGQPAVEPTVVLPPAPGQEALRVPGDGGYAPPPQRRRGLPLWAIILLSLAGLCVLGCALSFVGLSFLGSQVEEPFATIESGLSTAEAQPTEGSGLVVPTLEALPTRPPESTVEAAPTAVVGGGVVGGAVGGAAGAAQARTAEAEAAQALEATAEIGQLFSGAREVFKDEFVDNRNAWFVGVWEEIETDKIEDGVFKVIWAGSGSSYELYEVRDLTNFIAEVDCNVATGGADGSCGLVFGQKPDVGFYKFELFEDYYRLFIVQAEGDPPILTEGNPEGLVRPGDWNRLRVIKQGDRIRIYLNEAPLADVSDPTFPTGKVGVSTNSYLESTGVEVHFDNFVIWELP